MAYDGEKEHLHSFIASLDSVRCAFGLADTESIPKLGVPVSGFSG